MCSDQTGFGRPRRDEITAAHRLGRKEVSAPYQPPAPAPGGQPQNTLGLISLILGIISIPLGCCGAGIVFGGAAIVLGVLGKQKVAQGLANNGPQAQWGIITGIIGAALSLLWIIGIFVLNLSFIPSMY
jgi:hypothetical protein